MLPSIKFAPVLSTVLLTATIVVSPNAAQAQSLSSIFGPRSSELFFLDGIERLEREIHELQDRSENDIKLLNIAPSIEEQQQIIEEEGLGQENDSPSKYPDS